MKTSPLQHGAASKISVGESVPTHNEPNLWVFPRRERKDYLRARAPRFNFIALAPDLGDELWSDTINSRGQVLLAFFTTCHKGGSRVRESNGR